MSALTPEQRRLRARAAIHSRWAKTDNRRQATQAARDAFLKRFEDEVDPDGVLPLAERRIRAEHARKAHMHKLALKSAQTRRKAADDAA